MPLSENNPATLTIFVDDPQKPLLKACTSSSSFDVVLGDTKDDTIFTKPEAEGRATAVLRWEVWLRRQSWAVAEKGTVVLWGDKQILPEGWTFDGTTLHVQLKEQKDRVCAMPVGGCALL